MWCRGVGVYDVRMYHGMHASTHGLYIIHLMYALHVLHSTHAMHVMHAMHQVVDVLACFFLNLVSCHVHFLIHSFAQSSV